MASECKTDTYWESRWKEGRTEWHHTVVHNWLINYHDRLQGGANAGMKSLNVFVPLCGKSLDMLWLSEQGHRVLGVEMVRDALDDFVAEQKLPSTTSSVTNNSGESIPVIKAGEDEQISLFVSDIFKLDSAVLGRLDAIWDTGSYGALEPDLRRRYAALITTLVKPGGRILMEAFDYVQSEHAGPPFSTPEEEIKERFGGDFSVELLERAAAPSRMQEAFPSITTRLDRIVVLLVRNSA